MKGELVCAGPSRRFPVGGSVQRHTESHRREGEPSPCWDRVLRRVGEPPAVRRDVRRDEDVRRDVVDLFTFLAIREKGSSRCLHLEGDPAVFFWSRDTSPLSPWGMLRGECPAARGRAVPGGVALRGIVVDPSGRAAARRREPAMADLGKRERRPGGRRGIQRSRVRSHGYSPSGDVRRLGARLFHGPTGRHGPGRTHLSDEHWEAVPPFPEKRNGGGIQHLNVHADVDAERKGT